MPIPSTLWRKSRQNRRVSDALYLDYAATAPPLAVALEAFARVSAQAWANPDSLHRAGAQAARELERARRGLQRSLGAEEYHVVWTSSGTESDHLGVQGLARALRGRKTKPVLLVGAAEHPAVREAALALQAEGFVVQEIPVDKAGMVRPDALRPLLQKQVVLVAVQWANNELGGLNPIPELVTLTKTACPDAAFHVDAVQAASKRAEMLDGLGADSIAIAAHKVGGIRGCAALLLRRGGPDPIPLFRGGGHEKGLRAGTPNVAGAAAFAAATRFHCLRLAENPRLYHERRQLLLNALGQAFPNLHTLGPEEDREIQGSILSVAFPGERAELLLHQLEAADIYCGSGSACHTGHSESPVLQTIGLDPKLRDSVLRFSLGGEETEESLQRVVEALLVKKGAA